MKLLSRKEQIEERKGIVIDLMKYQEDVIQGLDSQIQNKQRSIFGGFDACRLIEEKTKSEMILDLITEYYNDLPEK